MGVGVGVGVGVCVGMGLALGIAMVVSGRSRVGGTLACGLGHGDIAWIFHAVQGPFTVRWKAKGYTIRLGSSNNAPLDGLAVVGDHDSWRLHGGYDVSLLVPENESNAGRVVNEGSG